MYYNSVTKNNKIQFYKIIIAIKQIRNSVNQRRGTYISDGVVRYEMNLGLRFKQIMKTDVYIKVLISNT